MVPDETIIYIYILYDIYIYNMIYIYIYYILYILYIYIISTNRICRKLKVGRQPRHIAVGSQCSESKEARQLPRVDQHITVKICDIWAVQIILVKSWWYYDSCMVEQKHQTHIICTYVYSIYIYKCDYMLYIYLNLSNVAQSWVDVAHDSSHPNHDGKGNHWECCNLPSTLW